MTGDEIALFLLEHGEKVPGHFIEYIEYTESDSETSDNNENSNESK